MITISEAAEILELTDAALYLGEQYQSYIYRADGVGNRFDIENYKIRKGYEDNFTSKTKLLLEYLVFEEDLRYQDLAKPIGVSVQSLHSHRFSFITATKLVNSLDEQILGRFESYYDFKSKWRQNEIK